jgi:hypothetical protein
MNMKRYILIHEYKYGTEVYEFKSASTEEELIENIEKVAELCGIDFDEDKGESITFSEMGDSELLTITL